MTEAVETAIIGAGPYGLSIAAHLRAQGLDYRIFGRPLETWQRHMPQGMLLKSQGFASNLSAPNPQSTLKAYCTESNIPYDDIAIPVPLESFIDYALHFQKRFVPDLDQREATSIALDGREFSITLDESTKIHARRIVVATGISGFSYVPDVLAQLPQSLVSHSADYHEFSRFAQKAVVVVGAGASAIDCADSLRESGAKVRILARTDAIDFHTPPGPRGLWERIRYPQSGIGPSIRSRLYQDFPQLFRLLPAHQRLSIVHKHLGPAPGWFMKQKVEGRIPMILGHEITGAFIDDGKVRLEVVDGQGTRQEIISDHVLAATGYRVDLRRLRFLAPELISEVEQIADAPVLSTNFESSVANLYFVGPAAAPTFGPLMRFMVGAEWVAPRLALHLSRKSKAG